MLQQEVWPPLLIRKKRGGDRGWGRSRVHREIMLGFQIHGLDDGAGLALERRRGKLLGLERAIGIEKPNVL